MVYETFQSGRHSVTGVAMILLVAFGNTAVLADLHRRLTELQRTIGGFVDLNAASDDRKNTP